MSTKNTSHQIQLNEGFIGVYDPSRYRLFYEPYVEKLANELEKHIRLRRFFVGNIFEDCFKQVKGKNRRKGKEYKNKENKGKGNTLFREFIKSARVFPAVNQKNSGHAFLDFFYKMQNMADVLFKEHLNRNVSEVCENAVKIKLFTPQTHIGTNKLTLVQSNRERNLEPFGAFYGTFYQMAPALWEFWIKPTDTGKMMELWIYCILKEHLKDKKFNVFNNVAVHESGPKFEKIPENIQELLATPYLETEKFTEVESQDDGLTEIDCLITEGDAVACFIECKSRNTKMEDVLKLHGMTKLLVLLLVF